MGRKNNAYERREQIVWALFDCLAEKGHEKITIKTIAAQAKMAPGIIHYYFKSKDEIVAILAEAILEKYSNIFYSRLAKANTRQQRIESLIDFLVDIIFDRRLNRAFYNLVQMSFERARLQKVMKSMFKNYRQELAGAVIEIGADPANPMLGAALLAITEGITVQLLIDPQAMKRIEVYEFISGAVRDLL